MNFNKTKWKEFTKTITLIGLVTLSFGLTFYLWSNDPTYDEKMVKKLDQPHYLNPQYQNQEIYQLVAPSSVILHRQNNKNWVPIDSSDFQKLILFIHDASISNPKEIEPTAEEWEKMYFNTIGIELQYTQDITPERLSAFFSSLKTLPQPWLSEMKSISKIWFYIDDDSNAVSAWIISDHDQKIKKVRTQLSIKAFTDILSEVQTNQINIIPTTVDGEAPWTDKEVDEKSETVPTETSFSFPRIFYLPTTSFEMKKLYYPYQEMNVDTILEWMFKNPISLFDNHDEKIYEEGDQFLFYNKKEKSVIYEDSNTKPTAKDMTMADDMNHIQAFVNRHHGWTNQYMLDTFQNENLDNRYRFRLFSNGLPVYWKSNEVHQPDKIELTPEFNGIKAYSRSLYYLDETEVISTASSFLSGKENLVNQLTAKKVELASITHIYLGYAGSFEQIQNKKSILLQPSWIIKTKQNEKIMVSLED
ncbi:hypothetical protein IC619_008425 [Hazenella sp. IB182353]|uniref:two-component system activity regulator YycH n=1 Tax=Polycladospora coralii TaxID=2771432 RepID=UPI001746314A|nr:two-component system activity regulator YycH [Polycladospora coralii]MBS7530514.1 hypothetical protein [Polycladospora coralii]